MAAVPTLSDGVVLLDAFTLGDVAAHVAGEDEEHARRFGWYPDRSTDVTARAAIEEWLKDWVDDGPTRAFAARDAADRSLLGGCQLRFRGEETAQLSYWVFPAARRRGYAKRIVTLVSRFGFDRLGLERIEAIVEPDNVASRRVLEGAGFVEEGVLRRRGRFRDGRRDMVLYSFLPSDRSERRP
jgi:RimJ/RimL family protein N-acetyltransferase